MKKTALYDLHAELGGKMVDFAGWMMPLHYGSAVKEHLETRNAVGLFDVSHMGVVDVVGSQAEAFCDYIATNVIAGREVGSATYTVLCNREGGVVDDTILYRLGEEHYRLVANASNRDADLAHLRQVAKDFSVEIMPHYEDIAVLALQGPRAAEVFSAPVMDPMQCREVEGMLVATTGYTGSGGYELMVPTERVVEVYRELLQKSAPIGLAARDSLRLESGFALYGHELSLDIPPIHSISRWTVKWEKGDFLGKEALLQMEQEGPFIRQRRLQMEEAGVPREGYAVWQGEERIGTLTSGGFGPSVEAGVAIASVTKKLKKEELVEVEIRGKRRKARVK